MWSPLLLSIAGLVFAYRRRLTLPRKTPDFDPKSVRHVLQPHELDNFLGVLREHDGPVVLDLETTGLNEHWLFARVVTLAVTLPQLDDDGWERSYPLTYVVGLSHPDSPLHTRWQVALERICHVLFMRDYGIIGQNVRFDVRWIAALTGIDLTHLIIADTGMSSHLLDENQTASLKTRCMKTFGIDSWIDFEWAEIERQQRKDPRYPFCPLLAERVDYFTMALYNARDTYWTWRLHQKHEEELGLHPDWNQELRDIGDRDSTNQLRLGNYYQEISLPGIRTLTDLEITGLGLDREWCENRLIELDGIVANSLVDLDKMLHEAEQEMDIWWAKSEVPVKAWTDLTNEVKSYEPTALYFLAFTQIMCASGRLRVLALTDKGRPSWSKAVLNRLSRMDYPAAITLLEYRKASKEASYIRGWLELASKEDRIHATYNYYRVVTGRLSASDPNPQQIPKTAKNAFCASPGKLLVTADYSQIELRVAAHQAQCIPMIEAFQRGDDLHRTMASIMNKCEPAEVTPEQRQGAKAGNFGFLFGMGAEKFVTYADVTYGVMFTHEEAEKIRNAFFETWVGMQEWHNRQRKHARDWGYVLSPLGRLRRLPNVWSGNSYLIGEAERQAINSPVQGMASDMMLIAAAKISAIPYLKPVALVHDAILVEVPEDRAEECAREIKNIMETIHGDLAKLGCAFSVPLVADVAVGRNWGSCVPLSA